MATPAQLKQVPWLPVCVFTLGSWALAWLTMLPLWLGDELASPFAIPLVVLMMFTPAVSALIVTFTLVKPRHPARYLGLAPLRSIWRSILIIVVAPLFWAALAAGAFLLAVQVGWATDEWFHNGMYFAYGDQMTVNGYALVVLAGLPMSTFVSSIWAFGAELGWRGFLATALAPLGFWQSALLTGVAAGIWFAPLIMLGYDYDRPDAAGALLMVVFTVCLAVILLWIRYATGTIWAAVVAHGAATAMIPHATLWVPDGATVETATMLGVPGWFLLGIVIAVLALLRQPSRLSLHQSLDR